MESRPSVDETWRGCTYGPSAAGRVLAPRRVQRLSGRGSRVRSQWCRNKSQQVRRPERQALSCRLCSELTQRLPARAEGCFDLFSPERRRCPKGMRNGAEVASPSPPDSNGAVDRAPIEQHDTSQPDGSHHSWPPRIRRASRSRTLPWMRADSYKGWPERRHC
jgi:hypothetical protein